MMRFASKYRAQKTEVDGRRFDSKKEAARYRELCLLERARKIQGLRCQVPFALEVNGLVVAKYTADFVYTDRGKQIVEDVKGYRTPVYRLKKKLMRAIHGIEILES